MTRQDDLKSLITKHQRHLQMLKEQQAAFGLHTPPHILIEIEVTEAEIERLLRELKGTGEKSPKPKLAASRAVESPVPAAIPADPQIVARRGQLRIFLCHAGEDKLQVTELCHQLKEAGYRPWLDKFDLLPGQYWRREIKKIIRDLNNIVLVCLSSNSVTKRGVVQQEIKWALDVLEQIPEDTIYLIPARLEACDAPEQLSELHWVNLFGPDGFEYLKRALDYEIGQRQEEPKPVSELPVKPELKSEPVTPPKPKKKEPTIRQPSVEPKRTTTTEAAPPKQPQSKPPESKPKEEVIPPKPKIRVPPTLMRKCTLRTQF